MKSNQKWYEAANEASFKTLAEGYVFQSPNPWIFARPRYYLVNESQKAEISVRLRRWRLLLVTQVTISLLIAVSVVALAILSPATLVSLFKPAFLQLGAGYFTVLAIVLTSLLIVPLAAVPHIYLIRALRPLLTDAPRTNERISMRDQLSTIAASVSRKHLVVCLVAALSMMAGAVLSMLGAFLDNHLARDLLYCLPVVAIGGLLTAYVLHLFKLKAKLAHISP